MDWLVYVLVCIVIALIALVVIGFIQRELKRHLVFWSLACVSYLVAYTMLLEFVGNSDPFFVRVVHPVFLALGGLFVVRGTFVYLERPMSAVLSAVFYLSIAWALSVSLAPGTGTPLIVLVPRLAVGLGYLWLSVITASRSVSTIYKGSKMIGVVLFLWGAVNLLVPLPWMTPHGYLVDGFLGLTAAISFLLLAMNSSQELLLEEERKFRALFDNANDAIFLCAAADDGCERLLEVNQEAERLLGYSRSELLAMDPGQLAAIGLQGCQLKLEGEGAARRTYETEYARKNGGGIPVEVSAHTFTLHGRIVTMSIARDIAERKQAEERIQYLALHDDLTGLTNRAYFERELARLSVASNLPLSLIMADLNGLKLTNDLFGHDQGDALLVAFGDVLRRAAPPGAVASRWGGDEFVLLMPGIDANAAQEAADRITGFCEEVASSPFGLSVALGVATALEIGSASGLLKAAEDRMYRHKFLEQKSSRSFTTRFMQQALEEKSHETEGHCERLQRMSARLGLALGLDSGEIDELSLVAVLHDIGKLNIPDQVLTKPGKLSEEEYRLIQGHSEIGYKIARASPELSSIARYIRGHHERWDGKGYPEGLAGEAIPLYSRIIAVADAYDAMVHRKGMSKGEALAELEKEAGKQFDPDIVKAFLTLLGGQEIEV